MAIDPLFEFGFGLSNTSFKLNADISTQVLVKNPGPRPNSKLKIAPGGNPDLWTEFVRVKCRVTNDDGKRDSGTALCFFA